MKRQSIQPTFDSRDLISPPYSVTTFVNGRDISYSRISDPFISTTVKIGWKDILVSFLKGGLKVRILVSGDLQRIEDVMELDGNYRGCAHSTRRDEYDARMQQVMEMSAPIPPEDEE